MFQLNSWIPLVGNSSKLAVRNGWKSLGLLWKERNGRILNRSHGHSTSHPYFRGRALGSNHPALGANASPEVTRLFCRLPLVTFSPLTRGYSPRSPDADSVRSRRKGRVDLRQSFHEDNQGTERYKNCIAFSMCSDACHQLKCRSRHQQRQREKKTLHGPGYPAIRRCEQLCSLSSPRLGFRNFDRIPCPPMPE